MISPLSFFGVTSRWDASSEITTFDSRDKRSAEGKRGEREKCRVSGDFEISRKCAAREDYESKISNVNFVVRERAEMLIDNSRRCLIAK